MGVGFGVTKRSGQRFNRTYARARTSTTNTSALFVDTSYLSANVLASKQNNRIRVRRLNLTCDVVAPKQALCGQGADHSHGTVTGSVNLIDELQAVPLQVEKIKRVFSYFTTLEHETSLVRIPLCVCNGCDVLVDFRTRTECKCNVGWSHSKQQLSDRTVKWECTRTSLRNKHAHTSFHSKTSITYALNMPGCAGAPSSAVIVGSARTLVCTSLYIDSGWIWKYFFTTE